MPIPTVTDFLSSFLASAEHLLEKVEDTFVNIGLVGLFVMMVLVSMNAVMRYLFASPVPGAIEITELYLMPMVIFLVAASLQRREGNVNVNLLKKRFRDEFKTLIDLFARGITLIIFFVIANSAGGRMWEAFNRGWKTIGVIEFPVYISWLIMTVGLLTFCIRLTLQIGGGLLEVKRWF